MKTAISAISLVIAAVFIAAFSSAGSAGAIMRDEARKDDARVVGLTRAEVSAIAEQTMPLPILRILSWKEMGLRKWVVEMSTAPLVAPKDTAIHVTFETEDANGADEVRRAFKFAGEYAVGLANQAVSK